MQVNQYLENALQSVNRTISLPENEIKRNNKILGEVVNLLISEMKKDALFNELYERVFYGGSFYDGLRVGEPNEFDLDILLRIPSRMSPIIDTTDIPGFVNCKIRSSNLDTNSAFLQMLDRDGFIKSTSVRQWMESMTSTALNRICPRGEINIFPHKLKVTTRKSGPAMTVHLQGYNISMDIDFTPCFVFKQNQWPEGGYRSNPVPGKPEFFIVPKTPNLQNLPYEVDLLWRLSFQEQEGELIEGRQFLKPALKLLKRLRDHQNHNAISSYYIKTMFLWEVEAKNIVFDKNLARAFLAMLNKYIEWLEKGQIPYFWNKSNNLLGDVHPSTLEHYVDRLKYIRRNIGNYNVNAYMGKASVCDEKDSKRVLGIKYILYDPSFYCSPSTVSISSL